MAIEISNLSKRYGDLMVLQDVSLSIPEGEATCIVGPSGLGKTTLLRLLMGLETPDSGEIHGLAGKRFSAVFQEDRLCENLSALSNIAMVRRDKNRDIFRTAMAELGLAGHEDKPVRELSGGMRRRVALLRALMADYDLLLLDEAFKGLDEENKVIAMNYTNTCNHGRTLVMVTHDEAEARYMGACILRLSPNGTRE